MSHGRYNFPSNPSRSIFSSPVSSVALDFKSAVEDSEVEIPSLYRCPISLGLMLRPMTILPCKHNADEININEWKLKSPTCPCCRGKINSLIKNDELKEVIDIYVQTQNNRQLISKEHAQLSAVKTQLQLENNNLTAAKTQLQSDNNKLASENKSLKTVMSSIVKDNKHESYVLEDRAASDFAKTNLILENTLSSIKAKLRAAEFMRVIYKSKVKRILMKLSVRIKDKKIQLEKLTRQFENEHKKIQENHIAIAKNMDLKDEKSILQLQRLQQSTNAWVAFFVGFKNEKSKLREDYILMNKAAKKIFAHYSKKLHVLNPSIFSMQAEIKLVREYKHTILSQSLEHSKVTMYKSPSLFEKNKPHGKLDAKVQNKPLSKQEQQVVDRQLVRLFEANADYSAICEMLSKGADPNVISLADSKELIVPPIFWAIYNAKLENIDLLLQSGAKANCFYKREWHTKFNSDKYLVHHNSGMTPFIFAAKLNHCHVFRSEYGAKMLSIIDLLLQKDSDINAADAKGMTALHWAAYYNDMGLTIRLLSRNADSKRLNSYGQSPLDVARERKSNSVITEILTQAMQGIAGPTLSVSLMGRRLA